MNKMKITYEEFKAAAEIAKAYQRQVVEEYGLKMAQIKEANFPVYTLETKIKDVDMSVRLWNCLKIGTQDWLRLEDATIYDLVSISEKEFKRMRNWGKKSLEELNEIKKMAGVVTI
jgi:DNA-directed RNA polymerase alpha subunit